MTSSEWERVDERVLGWVHSLPPSLTTGKIFDFRSQNPDVDRPIDGLEPEEVDQSLRRLVGYGFVAGHGDMPGLWWRLRMAPLGLVYLGEWPEFELATSSAALNRVLRTLADAAPPDDKDVLSRAAGAIGRTADDVFRGVLGEIAHDEGAEVG